MDVRVLHEFETSMRAVRALLASSTTVVIVCPGELVEEFGPPLTEEFRDVARRGGSVRVLVLGNLPVELRRELSETGVQLRYTREGRELGAIAGDHELFVFPIGQPTGIDAPQGAMVHIQDSAAAAWFLAAFEASWGAARTSAPPPPPARPPEGTTR